MEDKKNVGVFETLSKIDLSDKIEKKQKLTYLSWAWAWAKVKEKYPDATYQIWKDENGNPYTFDESLGYMCYTTVCIAGETLEMWLPVMNGANKAMTDKIYTYKVKKYEGSYPNKSFKGNFEDKEVEAATMFDINKTIMRCLVKNIAMFGLGLYIFAGEDLPEVDESLVPELIEKLDMKVVTDVVAEPFVLKASHIKDWNGKIYGRDEIFIAGEKRALPKETIAKLKLNPKYNPKSSK